MLSGTQLFVGLSCLTAVAAVAVSPRFLRYDDVIINAREVLPDDQTDRES